MNDSEKYIAEQIRIQVWSGLTKPEDVQEMISEILESDANEIMLRSLVTKEFEKKAQEELHWPEITDCDKLQSVFKNLINSGVIAIHNAGWDMGEAFHNCLEAFRNEGCPKHLFGICYYTQQDIESAVINGQMYLSYSSTRPDEEETVCPKLAKQIVDECLKAGLNASWDGNPQSRVELQIKWQLRSC
jgi:hypothetical protein